ncbi:MAG: HAD-IIIA family hydrolase [Burkholderiales bacterium]|nr:HAD-IIIA family hydrolase [Burkholderiales bacterium]
MNISLKTRRIRLAVFDVDGVLTDGRLYYSEAGEAMKAFDVRDGMGLKLLQDAGIELAIITSRRAPSVRLRAADLGIVRVLQGVADKRVAFDQMLTDMGITADEAAFMGDDLVDLPVFRCCGFAATVPAAPALLKRHADYVTRAAGGRGAVREFCEMMLHGRGTLAAQTRRFLDAAPQ